MNKDMNVRTKSLKFLKEIIGKIFHDTGCRTDFLGMTTKARATTSTTKNR